LDVGYPGKQMAIRRTVIINAAVDIAKSARLDVYCVLEASGDDDHIVVEDDVTVGPRGVIFGGVQIGTGAT
jgi:acetyltransferase-like isoleucine patch superfamily enzyme